jgi:hypothetical protein
VHMKKTKVMVFNSVNPCQEFVFESDVIERVQTFEYLGILLQTTPNLDNAVEHLVVASRRSLFARNHRCAELHIQTLNYAVTFSTRWCVPQQVMLVRFGWTLRK